MAMEIYSATGPFCAEAACLHLLITPLLEADYSAIGAVPSQKCPAERANMLFK